MAHYFMPGEPVTAQTFGDFLHEMADRDEQLMDSMREVLEDRVTRYEEIIDSLTERVEELLDRLAEQAA